MSKNKQQSFNTQFELVPDTIGAEFQEHFPVFPDGLVRTNPHGYVTLPAYAKSAAEFYNLKPRPDDVYVLTFPKSGTTWMQELVWLIVNDCDFEKAKKTQLFIRSPFLEMNYLLSNSDTDRFQREAIGRRTKLPLISKILEMFSYWKVMDYVRPLLHKAIGLTIGKMVRDIDEFEEMSSPRVIKSHLPFYLLHPELLNTAKVVYVARNPKDVIVSYFHYHRIMKFQQFVGDLDSFAEYFMTDKVYSSPYFPHLLDAWSKRHHPNLHFVFYEDLKRDLRGEIIKIAQFLGKKEKMSDAQFSQLVDHLRFDSFAKNESVNIEIGKELGLMNNKGNFIRKGKAGDWKNHFSTELNERINQWMEKNLDGSDLRFITELAQQD